MDILQNRKATRKFFIVAVVAATLSACSTSRQQPPAANANTNVAAAPEEAQPTAQEAKARPTVSRAAPSAEASSKKTTATILARIHQANLKEIAISKLAQGKASTSEVRAYADQLVQDHTNADQMVATMAQKTGAHLHESAHGSWRIRNCAPRVVWHLIGSFCSRPAPIRKDSSARCNRSAKMPVTMTSRR